MKITSKLLEEIGGKKIWPPTKLGLTYASGTTAIKGKKLLVAIVETPWGEHFKEVYSQSLLEELRQGMQTVTYYALSLKTVTALQKKINEQSANTDTGVMPLKETT